MAREEDTLASSGSNQRGLHQVVAWGSAPLRVLNVGLLALALALGIQSSLSHPTGDSGVADSIGYGAICGFFLAAALTRIEGNEGELTLINLLTVTKIPTGLISSMDGRNGLRIVCSNGRAFGHWGYGYSVLGAFRDNPGTQRAVERLLDWLHAQSGRVTSSEPLPEVRRTPRLTMIAWTLAFVLALLLLGSLAR